MVKYIFLALISLCLASCCDSGKTTAEVEKVNVDISINEKVAPLSVYCCTIVENKDYYFVTNTYVLNLPDGYELKYAEENHLSLHSEKGGRYEARLATKNHPNKSYKRFIITNKEIVTTVKLPYWE